MKISPSKCLALLTVLALASCQNLSRSDDPVGAAAETTNDAQNPVPKLEAYSCGDIARVHYSDGVLLASQPSVEGLVAAQMDGVQTIINLRHNEEPTMLQAEQNVVEALGMKYIHVPWEGGEELTDQVFDTMIHLLRTERRPILLHCDKYANRVGAVWLPYRVLEDGLSVDEATAEAVKIGMHSDDYEALAREYAEAYSTSR